MKHLAKTLLSSAILASAMLSSTAMAEQKIGVVDVDGIIQQMPQTIAMQTQIAAEFKDRQDEVKRLDEDIKYELNKRQREAATMSEAQIKELEGKIIAMRQELQAKAQPLQQEMQARFGAEQQKLISLLQRAMQTTAEEGKYDIIMQRKATAFVDPKHDLSDKVLETVSKLK